jgi:ribulose kinase
MDKNLAGLIGAVSALMAVAPAQAATGSPVTVESALEVSSYSDLLKPIPNAVALLKALTAAQAEATAGGTDSEAPAMIEEVQLIIQVPHHHHHHHHHHYRRRYHHHHHHHHDYYRR